MRIDKLEAGKTYKNYKELCNTLEVKSKQGKAKQLQLIDWEYYFRYEKKGHKFTINEVYVKPLQKIDNRKLGNNLLPFIDEMELLLINLLLNNKQKEMTISNSKLLLTLCLVNPNYLTYLKSKEQLSNLIDMDIGYIIDFYDVTNSTFKSAINTVNKRLESKKLIIHEVVTMVKFVDVPIDKTKTGYIKVHGVYDYNNELDSYNQKEIKPEEYYREATQEEKEWVLKIENNLMKNRYNCNNMQELFISGKAASYYTDLSDILFKELNIKSSYKAHRYIFHEDNLKKELKSLLNKHNISKLEREVNTKVMIRLDETNNKRYIKALNNLLDYDDNSKRVELRSNDNYVDNLNFLSSTLIDKNNVDSLK